VRQRRDARGDLGLPREARAPLPLEPVPPAPPGSRIHANRDRGRYPGRPIGGRDTPRCAAPPRTEVRR
jgi:hypothetical protein